MVPLSEKSIAKNVFGKTFSKKPYIEVHICGIGCSGCGHRMSHRKWRETKQQPSLLPCPAVPGCCFVSFNFLWSHTVHDYMSLSHQAFNKSCVVPVLMEVARNICGFKSGSRHGRVWHCRGQGGKGGIDAKSCALNVVEPVCSLQKELLLNLIYQLANTLEKSVYCLF